MKALLAGSFVSFRVTFQVTPLGAGVIACNWCIKILSWVMKMSSVSSLGRLSSLAHRREAIFFLSSGERLRRGPCRVES